MPQLKTAEEVDDARVYYSSIVNTVREALIILDEDLKVVSANNAFYALFEVSKETTEGRHIYELGSGQWNLDGLKEILEKIIPGNDCFQDYLIEYDFPVIGHKIMLLNGRRIDQGAGRSKLVLLAIEDVTERMQEKRSLAKYTAMLEDANEQLRVFDYSVSHALRTPLSVISGYAAILRQDYARRLDEEGKRILTVIGKRAREMEDLLRDLLRFSRISAEGMRLETVDMNRVVGSALAEVRTAFPGRNLRFDAYPLPPARCDASLIRQVWLNLLSNAAKFTRQRETAVIEITGRDDDREHIYAVKDNGLGFDVSRANALFGIFQRLHGAEEYEGTGAGLAIVRRIVQRHRGRVWAESETGKGAEFFFTLPKGSK